jgi:hypothetical protein
VLAGNLSSKLSGSDKGQWFFHVLRDAYLAGVCKDNRSKSTITVAVKCFLLLRIIVCFEDVTLEQFGLQTPNWRYDCTV